MKIIKIAVTGSAGSGKSLVCHRFNKIGLITLDCDIIARQVVESGTQGFKKIIELFFGEICLYYGIIFSAFFRICRNIFWDAFSSLLVNLGRTPLLQSLHDISAVFLITASLADLPSLRLNVFSNCLFAMIISFVFPSLPAHLKT